MCAAVTVAFRDEGPFEVDPDDPRGDVGKRLAGGGDRPKAVQQVVDGRGDQGRDRAGPCRAGAWARTIAATCSTVRSGLENECPHRPLIWMSQNAGATQSSSGSELAGPSARIERSVDQSVAHLELEPARVAEIAGDDVASSLSLRCPVAAGLALAQRGGDEIAEQRMRLGRLRLELGVELDGHEPGMIAAAR